MENIILTVHLIIALCLIGIVLVQRSEGGGLGVGGGGGGTTSGRPSITALGKLTWVFGIAFVITSISLTVIAARNANTGSVLDGDAITAPAQSTAPAGDALLPPSLPATGDAPLAPPRIDE
ncbi:preprotein translocase subunit SecG [uncultured Litoreibacter sp.]|uniref:preprotein translocase subunit SecG n=1 Tax=uncultured Litoreibacter sp. TaxID=1392394 RepID=UPI0026153AF8|nr:preprotein translocase subunit SecG [uncultured Litoreibacter sp.]